MWFCRKLLIPLGWNLHLMGDRLLCVWKLPTVETTILEMDSEDFQALSIGLFQIIHVRTVCSEQGVTLDSDFEVMNKMSLQVQHLHSGLRGLG